MEIKGMDLTVAGFLLTWLTGVFALGRAWGRVKANEIRLQEKLAELEKRQEKEVDKITQEIGDGFDKLERRTQADFERVFQTMKKELERINLQFYTPSGEPRFLTVAACDRKHGDMKTDLATLRNDFTRLNIAFGKVEQQVTTLKERMSEKRGGAS